MQIKYIVLRLIPCIRVHVWGGFGSQLFAIVLAERLKERNRRIHLIFHSSGTSERFLDIPSSWLSNFSVSQILDYRPLTLVSKRDSQDSRRSLMRKFLVTLLIKLGFINQANTEDEFKRIKPWVLSLRGHYSLIELSDIELSSLVVKFNASRTDSPAKYNAIHYRLGDLVSLKSKGPISKARIIEVIDLHLNSKLPLKVYSDSKVTDVRRILDLHLPQSDLECLTISPIETIRNCCFATSFLGTNSKLSLWTAVLRCQLQSDKTIIPREIYHHLSAMLGERLSKEKVIIY